MSTIAKKDELVRTKEYYLQKENELRNNNQMQIENLKATHQAQLDTVRDNSKQEIDVIRNRFGEKMSDREKQHVKEIENLKALYEKKLRDAKG